MGAWGRLTSTKMTGRTRRPRAGTGSCFWQAGSSSRLPHLPRGPVPRCPGWEETPLYSGSTWETKGDPGIEPMSPVSPALAGEFFTHWAIREVHYLLYFIPKSIWNTSSYFRVDIFHYIRKIQNVHTKPDNTVSLWLIWSRHFSAMEMLSHFPIPENSVWLMQKSSKAAHLPACPGISG